MTAIRTPEGTAVAPPSRLRSPRWWGAGAGLLVAVLDTVTMQALGMRFDMNGHPVGWLVILFFGSSFATLGFLLGWVIEGRRRDRAAAAVIRAQWDQIAAARAHVAQSEKLAALGQLGAVVAHEVRNPLAVIRSAAQTLAERLPDGDADAARACSFITAEIDRLATVVTSLLAFARPLRLEPRPVSVTALLDGAMLLASEDVAAKGVALTRGPVTDVPPVEVDPDLLRQVLLGLLTNAIEALPAGGDVRLEARAAADAVEIEVADSGPGVPPELRQRVFEPFFTTRPRGTGLGLAIARQIVEAHGGSLEVGERAGGGARFTVRLRPAALPGATGDGPRMRAVG